METKEYVKQVADKKRPYDVYPFENGALSEGLTLGLEKAVEFAEWIKSNCRPSMDRWYDMRRNDNKYYTTTELLTIFLTEKQTK